MDYGVGLDASLRLTWAEEAHVSREAARLGYTSLWTPESGGYDGFHVCAHRWRATNDAHPGGLTTGIAVSPVALRSPLGLAMGSGTVSALTGGRFILGIGTGGLHQRAGREAHGARPVSPLALMRDYLTVLRGLLDGERVTHDGPAVTVRGLRLDVDPPPRTPVYLGALGPQMLRLAGERADGVALNWCTAEQVAWSRERIAEGAARAGRSPDDVKVVQYIRVCVDEDEDRARRAFVPAMLGYALGRRGATPAEQRQGYRGHFERMGFGDALARLEDMRDRGASRDDLVDAFPPELARRVGYFGPAAGAADAFRSLAAGLDVAIVRVVPARPGPSPVIDTMAACLSPLLGERPTHSGG